MIVDTGALPHLVSLLKQYKNGGNSRALSGVIRRAADAITNLAHENANIKTRVRFTCLHILLFLYKLLYPLSNVSVVHSGLKTASPLLLNC